ncbi:MAG: hypothetical protein ABIK18_02885 [candidate division WOR-3 bacterium]
MARVSCPQCRTASQTWAQYEHRGCPASPTNLYTWRKEAEIGPDGRPLDYPCPGCQDGIPHPPSYFFCENCHHQWHP